MAGTLSNRLTWLRSGLFWRTFILLAILITVSMAAWVASFRMLERAPRARQIAAQVVSMVTITRAALTHSAPDSRRELLFDLASNEGIRVCIRVAFGIGFFSQAMVVMNCAGDFEVGRTAARACCCVAHDPTSIEARKDSGGSRFSGGRSRRCCQTARR